MSNLLFEPVKMGGLELKNRFLMSAAATWTSLESGDIDASGDLLHYRVSRGGTALVAGGGVGVHASARRGPTFALFNDDARIPSFRVFADNVKAGGAAVAFQVTHSGLWAGAYQKKTGGQPFAPSFVIDDAPGAYDSPKRWEEPASEDVIREVVEAYGAAAERAKKAGFQAVHIHAAHESLLAQFLSPATNLRKDDWGGSPEKRCRMHLEVTAAIRRRVGPVFPVYIKLGVQDGYPGGLILEDGLTAARLIAQAGQVDAIEVSQGLAAGPDPKDSALRIGIHAREKEAYYREWTRRVKDAIRDTPVLVIMQGGLRSLDLMEEVVANGEADLVSMCRPYIREPALVNRWRSGDRTRASCISCNRCLMEAYAKGLPLACVLTKEG